MFGIVLAAGAGSRIGGRAKAALTVGGKTFLERISSSLGEVGAVPVVVVGGPHQATVQAICAQLDIQSVVNPVAMHGGMGTSAAAGIRHALVSATTWAWLWPVDVPIVRVSTLRELMACRGAVGCVPSYRGRGGHPALVHRDLWPAIVAAAVATDGVRSALRDLPRVHVADTGVVLGVNTEAELNELTSCYNARP